MYHFSKIHIIAAVKWLEQHRGEILAFFSKFGRSLTRKPLDYSWVSLGYFAVNVSGDQPKMY